MHSAPPAVKERLWHVGSLTYTAGGLAILFMWLLMGDFAWAMRERSVGPMAQWYLSSLGVSSLLFALLFSSFPAAIGLVLSPIISVRSDRHRGPWGRRIPYLLLTTPIAALGMIGLGLTPILAKKVHAMMPEQSEVMVSLVCFAVFWAAFEFATIASYSVFGGLINDVVPQEMMGRFQALFRIVSLVDGFIFNQWLMGILPTHYTVIFITVGTFYGVAFFLVCLKVKEGEYPPPPPVISSNEPWNIRFGTEAKRYYNECFRTPYYVLIFFMLLINGLTTSPFNTFSMLYRKDVGMTIEMMGVYTSWCFVISLLLSYPIGWLCDKIHPLRVTMAIVAMYGLSCLWSACFVTNAGTFTIALVVHNIISGSFYTSSASLGARLFPRSRFAQYASAAGILGSLVGIVFAPTLGFVIDTSGAHARFTHALGALSGSIADATNALPDTHALGAVAGSLIHITAKQYHYTFAIGAFMCALSLILSILVYRRFLQHGGPYHYIAPE